MAEGKRHSIAIFAEKGSVARASVFRAIAEDEGVHLHFLEPEGYYSPSKEHELQGRLGALGINSLIVAIPKSELQLVEQFGVTLQTGDPRAIADFITNHNDVNWFQLTIRQFDYHKRVARLSRTIVMRLNRAVDAADLERLQSAKSLYVLRNIGRRASSREFMARFADSLAMKVGGVIGDVPKMR